MCNISSIVLVKIGQMLILYMLTPSKEPEKVKRC